jgi:single-strand DNA-binding protein
MRSLNKVMLIGNLGSDPEVRTTGGGAKVAEFSLATGRQWTDRNGQKQEKTEWHRVTAWKGLADVVESYAKKGDRIYVEGEINYRTFDDKDGDTRYVTEINAREVLLLGGKEGQTRQPVAAAAKKETSYDDFPADFPEADSDLPF